MRIRVRPSVTYKGGDLRLGLEALRDNARGDVKQIITEVATEVVTDAISNTWPIDRTIPHSIELFEIQDHSSGTLVDIRIVNRADYAKYIYEPGSNRRKLVWLRDIYNPLLRRKSDILQRIVAALRRRTRE